MTDTDAFLIQSSIAELEFPFTFEKALQFALFRTYGIPSISKLLVYTSQFSSVETACKRFADTVVLTSEFVGNAPASERTLEAISRMNYIHGVYQRAGKITNEDMLYTLSLFAGEPVKWIERYEWRKLESVEKCAIGTYWKSIGDAMGISYGKLPSADKGWKDGLQWLEEVVEWGEKYEDMYMVPNESNKTTADQTTKILLWGVPNALKQHGKHIVCALMDDKLRKAMIYDKPPQIYFDLVEFVFTLRKIFLRYLALPRPYFMRVQNVTEKPSKEGRYFVQKYDSAPYYVQPTKWNRWGPAAWVSWSMGLPLPGDEGEKYFPKGYRFEEVGPDFMFGKGADAARETVQMLKESRTGGCPFPFSNAE